MTKREKRLQKLRQNPKTVSFDDLRTVLERFGFTLIRSSGSHFHFRAKVDDTIFQVTVPLKRPYIKAVYIKRVLEVIDELISMSNDDEDDNNDDSSRDNGHDDDSEDDDNNYNRHSATPDGNDSSNNDDDGSGEKKGEPPIISIEDAIGECPFVATPRGSAARVPFCGCGGCSLFSVNLAACLARL